ncbi:MAG: hypothetical protein KKD18_00515 [Nanoarchaeota archaeon]|nr:hypothetical protein [Nanoarchaeota archaeon]MBU0976882.1 hypothetical protein [Nanoarchaeota archaeon]
MVTSKKGGSPLIITIIVLVIIAGGVIAYFINNNGNGGETLPEDICIYNDEKQITCGAAYVIVLEGSEYPLTANEPFYFPQGEGEMIGLVDQSKPEGERSFLLFLEEGRHTINEETSRRAVGSFLAK